MFVKTITPNTILNMTKFNIKRQGHFPEINEYSKYGTQRKYRYAERNILQNQREQKEPRADGSERLKTLNRKTIGKMDYGLETENL